MKKMAPFQRRTSSSNHLGTCSSGKADCIGPVSATLAPHHTRTAATGATTSGAGTTTALSPHANGQNGTGCRVRRNRNSPCRGLSYWEGERGERERGFIVECRFLAAKLYSWLRPLVKSSCHQLVDLDRVESRSTLLSEGGKAPVTSRSALSNRALSISSRRNPHPHPRTNRGESPPPRSASSS